MKIKTEKQKIKISLIIVFLLLLLSMALPVRAEEVSLAISPPLLEVMIQPGKSITQAYQISNQGTVDLYLRALLVPFTARGSQGKIELLTENQESGPSQIFSLANAQLQLGQTFKLAANSEKQLVLRISPPPDWPEGDYYYTFLIEQSSQGTFLTQTGSQQLIKIGSNILLTVSQSGQPIKKGIIDQFSVQPKLADLFDSVKFKLLIKNVGQAYFKPQGKIEIYYQLNQKRVAQMELRPDNILINSRREIICSDGPCSFQSWRPGKYQAKISFAPDGQGELISATVFFWLLPFRALALVFISLSLLLFLTKRRIIGYS